MYSVTKTHVPLSTAQAIIRSHFDDLGKIHTFIGFTDGLYNAAYLIELESGLKCVLRVAPPDNVRVLRYERNIMQAEADALRLVRQATTVPVPEIYSHDTSRRLIENDYILMSYIPGVDLNKLRQSLATEELATIHRQVGGYLRQINTIRGEHFGFLAQESPCTYSWKQFFDRMLGDILQDGLDFQVALPLPYDDIYRRLQQGFSVLEEVVTPVLVHWDLWDGNIFIDPQTKRITGLIDFERSLWGDPLMEVNFYGMEETSPFLEGYGTVEDKSGMLGTPARKMRRLLYNIYLLLIMIVECYYRGYETQDQEKWARQNLVKELQTFEKYLLTP